jgi:hypothetical protein
VLNDDGIHVLIAHDNRQLAAYLAAGSLIVGTLPTARSVLR